MIPMSADPHHDSFYARVPVFRGFARLMDPALYQPLPDDWTVGIADIVKSTAAIAARRYKSVNMAGAAVIAAVTNALDHREFPFVFGGDGASFAVPPGDLVYPRLLGLSDEQIRTAFDPPLDQQELDAAWHLYRLDPKPIDRHIARSRLVA